MLDRCQGEAILAFEMMEEAALGDAGGRAEIVHCRGGVTFGANHAQGGGQEFCLCVGCYLRGHAATIPVGRTRPTGRSSVKHESDKFERRQLRPGLCVGNLPKSWATVVHTSHLLPSDQSIWGAVFKSTHRSSWRRCRASPICRSAAPPSNWAP